MSLTTSRGTKELSIQKLYEKYPQCNCKII